MSEYIQTCERNEDMSPDARLKLFREEDGDIIVSIIPSTEKLRKNYSFGLEAMEVQFCTIGSGGGRSPHTRKALFALMEAIELDNKENPIDSETERRGVIYDTEMIPAGKYKSIRFFEYCEGQQARYCPVKKDSTWTNMSQSGMLPYPAQLIVDGISCLPPAAKKIVLMHNGEEGKVGGTHIKSGDAFHVELRGVNFAVDTRVKIAICGVIPNGVPARVKLEEVSS